MNGNEASALPVIVPLGEAALLVRFAEGLSDEANRRAVAFARRLERAMPDGAEEIAPNLVSVLVRFDPTRIEPETLAGALRLLLVGNEPDEPEAKLHEVTVAFGGQEGPDLVEAAQALGLAPNDFITRHNAGPLRVLTTGFAPGFVYCGFHGAELMVPRRKAIRERVPEGSILFAAGQTAITATPVRTGWYVIGRTGFRNFDPHAMPPTRLGEGDIIRFRPQ